MWPKIWALIQLLLFLTCFPARTVAEGRSTERPQNEVSIDLFGPLGAILKIVPGGNVYLPIAIEYETVVREHLAVSISPSIAYRSGIAGSYTIIFLSWVELDWHPFDKDLNGFFVGLALLYPISIQGTTDNAEALEVGGAIGYNFLLFENITLDLALHIASQSAYLANVSIFKHTIYAQIVTELGYRF
jgi:hypothetical protein